MNRISNGRTPKGGHTNGTHRNGVHRIAEQAEVAPLKPSATDAAEAPKTADEGRGAGGKFGPGNRFGRGNPHARRMAALRQAFMSTATEERMRELGEKLYAAAAGGDWQAAKLFLLFVVGRPADSVNPDTLDLEEFRLLASAPSKGRLLLEVSDSLPPGPAADLLKRAWALVANADAVVEVMKREYPAGPLADGPLQVFTEERKAKRAKRG